MRNFIVFFTEKEGSSPLMHLLDNFPEIDVVHQINNQGWEPLEEHEVGPLSIGKLSRLLDYIYDYRSSSTQRLNKLYTKTSTLPIRQLDRRRSVGFKMRLTPHNYIYPITRSKFQWWNKLWKGILQDKYPHKFRQKVLAAIRKHNLVVFFTVRQDVLRWALSKYHGDGTGKPGHLQFRLATGEISESDINKIHVDCDRLEQVIVDCESKHKQYRRLYEQLVATGVDVHPLKYEEFLDNKQGYFRHLGECLGINWNRPQIDAALARGAYLRKVHSTNIAEFVSNDDEVLEKFGDRFVSWS